MPGWLKLQPAAVGSVVAALYVAGAMLYRVFNHSGVFAPDELVAAFYAVYGLFVQRVVTPLARPRDKGGRPLVIRGHVEQ